MSSSNDTEIDKTQKTSISKEQTDESSPVHSANSWETAELVGDEARKSKFLRLMGAGKKKEHHAPIVIGDHNPTHERSKTDTEKITSELENQYQQSLCHKLSGGARAHLGFGFQQETTDKEEPPKDEIVKEHTLDEKCDKSGEKRKFEESTTEDIESKPSEEKQIKFVKSSS